MCGILNNAISLGSKRGRSISTTSGSGQESESPRPATKQTKQPIIGSTYASYMNVPSSQKKCDNLFVDMMISDISSLLSTPTMDKSQTATTSAASPEEANPATEASSQHDKAASHHDEAASQHNEAAFHPWPHLTQFFTTTAHPKKEGKLKALCLSCQPRKVSKYFLLVFLHKFWE